MSTVTAGFELVTPEVAAQWLEGPSADIRQARKSRIDRYARVMELGRWRPSWDGIAFGANGERLNGNHRLKAVVRSNVACWFLVVRGLPAEALIIGDQGTKRTTRQVLAQMGERNPSALAAALRYLWQWRTGYQIGDKSQDASPDVTDLLDLLKKEPGLRGSVPAGTQLRRNAGLGSDGLGIVLSHLFTETDPDEADAFFDQLAHGTTLQPGDPILVLREALIRLGRGAGATKGIDVTYKAAIIVKAFNLWRAGARIESIGWRRGGKSPEAFPGIEPASERTRVASAR